MGRGAGGSAADREIRERCQQGVALDAAQADPALAQGVVRIVGQDDRAAAVFVTALGAHDLAEGAWQVVTPESVLECSAVACCLSSGSNRRRKAEAAITLAVRIRDLWPASLTLMSAFSCE